MVIQINKHGCISFVTVSRVLVSNGHAIAILKDGRVIRL